MPCLMLFMPPDAAMFYATPPIRRYDVLSYFAMLLQSPLAALPATACRLLMIDADTLMPYAVAAAAVCYDTLMAASLLLLFCF